MTGPSSPRKRGPVSQSIVVARSARSALGPAPATTRSSSLAGDDSSPQLALLSSALAIAHHPRSDGRRLLPRQDAQRADRRRRRRRVRPARAPDRAPHRRATCPAIRPWCAEHDRRSGLKMTNYLDSQAPRDGTHIGVVQNTLIAAQAVGLPGVQFDARSFHWLGAIAPVVETMAVWHTTGVTTIEDARKKEIIAGSTARGAITYGYPSLMNEFGRNQASRSSRATTAATRSTSPWSAARSRRATIRGRAGRPPSRLAQGEEDRRDHAGGPARARP